MGKICLSDAFLHIQNCTNISEQQKITASGCLYRCTAICNKDCHIEFYVDGFTYYPESLISEEHIDCSFKGTSIFYIRNIEEIITSNKKIELIFTGGTKVILQ